VPGAGYVATDRRNLGLQPRNDRLLPQVGFRFAGVRKGYFDGYPMVVVENGIRARDMVMFEMELG